LNGQRSTLIVEEPASVLGRPTWRWERGTGFEGRGARVDDRGGLENR
jgi:hypothetical protein